MDWLARLSNKIHPVVEVDSRAFSGNDIKVGVDYQTVRVRSARHELVVTPEALGAVFSIPAWSQNRTLRYQALDSTWADNHARVMSLIQSWWGYKTGELAVGRQVDQPKPNIHKTGLAFSLGVDSMYSCFFSSTRPDMLVLVGGFDTPWGATPIFKKMADSTREIAGALGMDWTLVETNLRQHYLFRRVTWERTYGSAVAFVGMTLSKHIDRMLISSGIHVKDLIPDGSHPDLDPLWSSSYLQMQHVGQEVTRVQKVERLISDPLSREMFKRHVRVCWEKPGVSGNCGECTKCVLLKLSLLKLNAGFVPDTMPDHQDIGLLLDGFRPLLHPASVAYRKELLGIPDQNIDRALRRYIERSERTIQTMNGLREL